MWLGVLCLLCGVGASFYAGYLHNLKDIGKTVPGVAGNFRLWLGLSFALNAAGIVLLWINS